jgi:hypothetical protein
MPTALIISLNFNPGHASHLVASYRQCEELGYESVFYIDGAFKSFLPPQGRCFVYGEDRCPQAEVAFFLFPSQKNLSLILKLKRQGTKILYVFHEPLAPLKEYRKAGLSLTYLAKLWLINRISSLTVKWSDAILLPSKKAVELYQANSLYRHPCYHYIPLLFDDERTPDSVATERHYCSYIGTVAADHSFNEYLRFVEWAIRDNRIPNLHFLIATKSQFDIPELLLSSPRVTIRKGSPLSNPEINACYSSSYAIWNAYTRTTQSGVLAKSFMFGTPTIVLRKNLSEFTTDGKEVVAIDDNNSFVEIEAALQRILLEFDSFSGNARKRFIDSFYYRTYNERVKEILDSLTN